MRKVLSSLLIVEDNSDHLDLIRRAFKRDDPAIGIFAATTLLDAEEALTERGISPDLILADLRLPDGDAIQLLEPESPCSSVPIVILTAQGNERIAVEALKKGALDYVVKSEATLGDMPHIVERAYAQCLAQREREEMARALRESEERYSLAVNGSTDVIWDWHIRSGRLFISDRARSLIGLEAVPQTIATFNELIHPLDLDSYNSHLLAHLEQRSAHFEHEFRLRSGSGDYRWVLVRGLGIRDADGQCYRMAGSLSEITHRKRLEQQLRQHAFHDPLTGLSNRGFFLERLDHRLRSWKSGHTLPFAVLFLDFDRFKFVNDSLGHAAGDLFLKLVAAKLKSCLREPDLVARFGSDEFAVLLESVSGRTEALGLAERILETLQAPLDLKGETVYPGVRLGLAFSTDHSGAAGDLIRAADVAMHQAKTEGSLRLAIADDKALSASRESLALEHDLRRALAENQLYLVYQPILDLSTLRTVAWECLLRWRHPIRGSLPAADFVPLAEDCGLIVELDHWVLHHVAVRQREFHRESGAVPLLSVNVAARFFSKAEFIETLELASRTAGLDQKWLDIEITEHSIVENPGMIEEAAARLKQLQISLWLDDFGTGYSSLSYLTQIPLERVKIDLSFVARMLTHEKDLTVVKAILSLTRSLEIPAIAEGVETGEQARKLVELGCQYAQGIHFSEPVTFDRLKEGFLRQI